jgi:hypothetical protein
MEFLNKVLISEKNITSYKGKCRFGKNHHTLEWIRSPPPEVKSFLDEERHKNTVFLKVRN